MHADHDSRDLARAVPKEHALAQMAKRQITPEAVRDVLRAPEEVLAVRSGRVVAQSVIVGPTGRAYLLRVFVDVDTESPEIVTAYRTSNIEKYRSRP